MGVIEAKVRTIEADGLLWGASKLVPLAYGIKKLQISCVVEDDKVICALSALFWQKVVTFSVLQCLCGTHNWYLELYMIRLLIAQGVQLYSRLSLFRLSEVRPPRYIGHLAWHGMLATVEPP